MSVFKSRFAGAEAGESVNVAFIREQYNEACAEQERGPSDDEIVAMQIIPSSSLVLPRQYVMTKHGRTFSREISAVAGTSGPWREEGEPVPGTAARVQFNNVRETAGDLLEAALADKKSRR